MDRRGGACGHRFRRCRGRCQHAAGRSTRPARRPPQRALDDFKLKGGRPNVFQIDAAGRFGDIRGVDGLEAHVNLDAANLAVLGELLRRPLPPIGPFGFSGEVEGHEGEVVTHGVEARIDRTYLHGSFSGSFAPGGRPHFTAQLQAPELYVDEGGAFLQNVRLDGKLEDGALSLHHTAFDFDGGTIEGVAELDSSASPPTVVLRANAQDMLLRRLLEQLNESNAYSGKLYAKADLRTRGKSQHELVTGVRPLLEIWQKLTGHDPSRSECAKLLGSVQ